MTYEEWEREIPASISDDVLWKMRVYRYSLFLSELAWSDVTKLMDDRRTVALADQLYRAVGSISANLAEGYSRYTGKDRARFYAYSLGSARESRDWYYKSRHILGDIVFEHRAQFLAQIIRQLKTIIAKERNTATQK
ncbi:MAG: four helix bundle protein [Caldilineaceae bacterium]